MDMFELIEGGETLKKTHLDLGGNIHNYGFPAGRARNITRVILEFER